MAGPMSTASVRRSTSCSGPVEDRATGPRFDPARRSPDGLGRPAPWSRRVDPSGHAAGCRRTIPERGGATAGHRGPLVPGTTDPREGFGLPRPGRDARGLRRSGSEYLGRRILGQARGTTTVVPPSPQRDRRSWATAALILIAATLLGWGIIASSRMADPLHPGLDVKVWKAGHLEETGRERLGNRYPTPPARRRDPDPGQHDPAHPGRKAYFYLVWLEASGKVTPIYPWRDQRWEPAPAPAPAEMLSYPAVPVGSGLPDLSTGVRGGLESQTPAVPLVAGP